MGFQIATNRQNWTGRYFWESWWRWRELFCFIAIQNATHPFRKGTSKINRNNVELFLRRLTHFSMFVSTIRPNYKAYLFPSEADQILDKNAGRRYFGKIFGSNIEEKYFKEQILNGWGAACSQVRRVRKILRKILLENIGANRNCWRGEAWSRVRSDKHWRLLPNLQHWAELGKNRFWDFGKTSKDCQQH